MREGEAENQIRQLPPNKLATASTEVTQLLKL